MTGRRVGDIVRSAVIHLVLLILPLPLPADGLAWLAGQARSDGRIVAVPEMALPLQATAEAVRALRAIGAQDHPVFEPARNFLSEGPVPTEEVARSITDNCEAGGDASTAVAVLLAGQNADGGFGERPGFESSVIDTAFALEALALSGQGQTDAAARTAGFLLGRQSIDGGWAEGSRDPSVYLTALAMRSLWLERNSYPVGNALDRAQAWLLSQRTGASWGESHETALALLALLPRRSHAGQFTDSAEALRARQRPDGSWNGSVYATALSLRALALADEPAANPDLGVISGRVTDGDTGLPVSGAAAVLRGPSKMDRASGADGGFRFADLPAGKYTLAIEPAGYSALSTSIDLAAGASLDLGELAVLRGEASDTGTVTGVVSDARTQEPLAGVVVRAGELGTQSGPDGTYQISNAPAGTVTLTVTHPGYAGTVASGSLLAGSVLVFSPRLEPGINPDPSLSTIMGTVSDGATGALLEGAQVALAGCVEIAATTGADGAYHLTTDQVCTVTLMASMDGYDSYRRQITLVGGAYLRFPVRLYPVATTPPDANATTITGIVLDAATGRPLGGVEIVAGGNRNSVTTLSDAGGRFAVPRVSRPEIPIAFSASGYVDVATSLIVEPVDVHDMGEVRLRPEGTEVLAPDLVVTVVGKSTPFADPDDYHVAGELAVEVKNPGNRPVSGGLDVKAFHDADANRRFDAASDTSLGEIFLADVLGPGGRATVDIPVAGYLPFRDAPVTVAVDTATRVVEASEENNADTTASLCRRAPPLNVFDPVLKWHRRGPEGGAARGVLGPPMVGQFSDDNGDGSIDAEDNPDLVFVDSSSALNIVSGSDGTLILRRTDLPLSWLGSVSLGDIDADGLYEIIVPDRNNRSELFALEHDGSVKWRVPTGPSHNGSFRVPRDGVAIADLDADGRPEIVHGARVLSADGTMLWRGTKDAGGYRNYGYLPIVADIDLDGTQEVIAGRSVYDYAGNVVWYAGTLVSDGFNAVGNFDEDEYAEIVLVASGRVYLLAHDGSRIWGPVSIPGGGQGGPPTVADFDGDGRPEIGVAGYRRYTVFDGDGSVLWARPVKDFSSARTGSSVFDFDNDGRAEVLYNDEDYFYIFGGEDGRLLLQIPNGSGTTLEYPVVVNIDDDASPEIVLPSSDDRYGTMGVRVFESASDAWVPTRSVWNQHSYHIGNIDDDGRIPADEPPSWLSHNTYRLNAFLDRDPRDAPDLTLGGLVLSDNGPARRFSARVRAGNGGLLRPPGAVDVSLYQGKGSTDRVLLASKAVEAPAPGISTELHFEGIALDDRVPLMAVINGPRDVSECDFSNNEVAVPVTVVPPGDIEVATDRAHYLENIPVTLTSVSTNTGSFAADYTARLRVEDAAGNIVRQLPDYTIGALAAGAAWPTEALWQTNGIYAGEYTLRGTLHGPDGALLDEDAAPFLIESRSPVIDGEVATGRAAYGAWDEVELTSRVRNMTGNAIQPPTIAEITVSGPDGAFIASFAHDVPELLPGGTFEWGDTLRLADAPSGTHSVRLELKDPQAGGLLDIDEARYVVTRQASQGLRGTVTAWFPRVYPGEPNGCTERVHNLASQPLTMLTLQHLLVRFEAEAIIDRIEWPMDLGSGGEFERRLSIDTLDLVPGGYACLLRATVDGITVDLESASFVVLEPPIRLDAALAIGEYGRMLVLLDDGLDARDPHGPDDAPPLHEQRAFLRGLLDRNGISYVIVSRAAEFATELRTGAYSTYLLLSEQEKLPELVAAELQEAVFADEGLIELGSHDQRHGRIDEALGIGYKGRLPAVAGFQPVTGELALLEGAVFPLADKGLRALVDSATAEAHFGDPGISPPPDPDIAVTSNAYGWGRSIYGGFDFQVQAASAGDVMPWEGLLLASIGFVQPGDYLRPGRAVPVTLTLANQGVATPGRIVLNLPAGSVAVDVPGGEISPDGNPAWRFDAAEGEVLSFTAWVAFPEGGADYRLEADVLTGIYPDQVHYTAVGLDLTVAAPVDPDEPGILLDAVAGDRAYRQAANFFARARVELAAGRFTSAIRFFSKTADELGEVGSTDADALRRQIARLIRQTEMQMQ